MASPSNNPPTIEDFGLERQPWDGFFSEEANFMAPYLDPEEYGRWLPFAISDPAKGQLSMGMGNHYRLCSYAVSPSRAAYIVSTVFLTSGNGPNADRRTAMRHRDMALDNYIKSGADPKLWRWFGVAQILNPGTIQCIADSFEELELDITSECSFEFSPHDHSIVGRNLTLLNRQNQCVRGVESLIKHYGETVMGGAKVKRFIFVSSGYPYWVREELRMGLEPPPEALNPDLHMLVEFFRPGDEGYPAPEAST